jgi:NADPH:quinone reductase-like Zn-dependent oxidoreductase
MTGLPYPIRLAGYGFRAPKNPIIGSDIAVVVETVGKDVRRFQPGDAVFGIGKGSYAEYVCAGEDKLAHKPENLTFEQAAVVAISGLTALGTFVSMQNYEDMIVLKDFIEPGKVTPVIDRTYPLAEAPGAIRYLQEGHVQGKVAITV